jgi:DUF971 family protein
MATRVSRPPVLDAENAAFVASDGISCSIAARDAANRPSVGKAFAVRVSADRQRLEVFVDAERCAEVVRDLRAASPVAVVFSQPSTHRTIQVKSPAARVVAAAADDRAYVAHKVDAVVEHLVPLGFPRDGLRAFFAYAPDSLLKVVFEPDAAFAQTPGPGAGKRLAS